MSRLGVELEVGWLVTAALPAPDAPDFRARLVDAVRPVPVIELLERRIAGPLADDPIVKLADGLLNWGLVVGAPLDNWDGTDFCQVHGSMRVGESVLLAGKTSVPGGSALATLEAFLAAVGQHCVGVHPGHLLITGTLHPLTWIDAEAEIRGEIDQLGSVEFTLRGP
jgi:2-keto-4-pentenoate hydratase